MWATAAKALNKATSVTLIAVQSIIWKHFNVVNGTTTLNYLIFNRSGRPGFTLLVAGEHISSFYAADNTIEDN